MAKRSLWCVLPVLRCPWWRLRPGERDLLGRSPKIQKSRSSACGRPASYRRGGKMAKNSSGGAADWKRRVEGDVIKLLGGQPRRADSARRFVDELLKGGMKRTTAARMVCASESDDPSRCAVTIPEKPRVSLAKSDRPLFQGEINWTKPRSDAKKKADSKSVPEPSAAPKAPLQVGQRVRVRTDRVVHFGPTREGLAPSQSPTG